ncbi:MAG: tripartite tricarboxylate transporter substrate binding protein [Alcaligenaceae bacterium]|nr:tripartite tricarboxylate transporter substrate binding protein [Alcaligenaceae bacterium]
MKTRILTGLAALLLSVNCLAAFPERAVTLVSPFPAGGASDVIARLLSRQLELQLGKPVIVENKAGAGSVIGAAYVANAKPDGYTLLLGSNSTFVLNPALMAQIPYDATVAFDAIGKIGVLGLALLVNPQVPAKNVAELIALIRANPDKYSYASYGNGTTSNFAGAMFNSATGLNVMHIPYKGSTPAMNDTIGGQVPMAYDTILATAPQHNAGRIRALAVTSLKRSPLLPNIPTLAESGLKDFNIVAWNAVVAPKGLPADVKAVLQKALKAVIDDPAVVEKMAATGFDISWNPANDWAQMIRAEIAESKDIAAKAKIKIE